ncbi:MAG: enoyl-CoA hydratase/isomerase family protein [Deltaproteobacteria bacterium]|nr:enoyl-CoA hydratase/isomerase family protein [Deltaproteobacteria bacterium]
METYQTLELKQLDEVMTVSLNRPPLNLFNQKMIEELIDLFHSLGKDRRIRFIILTAKGNNFSGGVDLKEINGLINRQDFNPADARYQQLMGHELMRSLENLEQITVAALKGAVIGAGMAVAMACDFRIMVEDGYFSVPEAMVGVYFTWGCTPRLVRMVGASKAMEIIMTCDAIPATEAYRVGLANKIVPQDRLIEATHSFIAKIASHSPTAVRITKKIVLGASMQGFGNTFICEPELMQGLTTTGETGEGIKAFLEKRRPQYKK